MPGRAPALRVPFPIHRLDVVLEQNPATHVVDIDAGRQEIANLRIEIVVHNTKELRYGRSLEKFPEIVVQAKSILGPFMDALSCIDPCCIADGMLEQLPAPSQVGKTKVGGIDLNRPRMRWVVEAVMALSASPHGFTASELARQVRALSQQRESEYGARRAAYNLKKLRGKKIVRRIDQTRRYVRCRKD